MNFTIDGFWKKRLLVSNRGQSGLVAGWKHIDTGLGTFLQAPLTLGEGFGDADPAESNVILVSAPGAVGKSTLAREIAHKTGAMLLDLAQAEPVGANTVVGGLAITGLYEPYLQGKASLIVDGLDEARMRVTEESFAAFMGDIVRLIGLNRKPVVLFGRTAAVEEAWFSLRVRPETLCRITEFSEHESNGRELDEGERVAVEVLPVLGQSAAAVEPGDGAFDHPTPGLDDEALHPIGSLDDLGLEIGQDAGQGAVKDRALIGAVGEQFPEKGKQTEQGRQQRETAVAILNVGGGDDAVQQQALRIDQNMPLLALDQLAGIEAVAVDASPPFSALFTL